jgi:ketosteroid isomerase-like protein
MAIRSAVLAILVILAGAGGCRRPSVVTEQADSAAILAVIDSFHVAFQAEDSARIGRLLSPDPTFFFFGTDAGEMQASRQEFLTKHERVDWAQLDSIAFGAPQQIHFQAVPELAVVMYETTLRYVAGGRRDSLPMRLVLTLAREDGRWRIRQGLGSRIAQ